MDNEAVGGQGSCWWTRKVGGQGRLVDKEAIGGQGRLVDKEAVGGQVATNTHVLLRSCLT